MRRYIFLSLVLFISVVLLGGCSNSNKEGQPISTSVTTGAVSPDNNLQAEITGVTISSPPVVTFKLLDENGQPLRAGRPRALSGADGDRAFSEGI